MFKIEMIYRHDSDLVTVKVTMPAKEWTKMKLKGQLGQLYGVDISNHVYREFGVQASNPIVADDMRAKGGIKLIELSYADSTWIEPVNNVIHVDFKARRRAA